jgi:hypothetical protein
MQKSLSSSKQKSFLELLGHVREEAGIRQIDVADRLDQLE